MSETNFNLIDPNKSILKGTPWYDNDDERLGIPPFEDIRSFVQLTMKPKNPNFIELDNTNIVNASPISDASIVELGGFYIKDGVKYYSTNYTDEIMGSNDDLNKSYESFGIKSVEITFDPNKIPQVTVVFYDVRGNVINNFENKYAKMFQLPYPIFTLTIKGGFGPSVDYKLLKIKDDIAIDELGNYIITSKFIGDRFSPLSDLPLLYLMPVPYLKGLKFDIFDNQITSFHEFIISAKRLNEKLNSELNSDQEIANQKQITNLKDELINYQNKLKSIEDKTTFYSWFTENETFKGYSKTTQDVIINYVKSCTFENYKINFPSLTVLSLSNEFYKYISDTVKTNVDNINEDESLVIIKYSSFDVTDINSVINTAKSVQTVKSIDYTGLVDKIKEKQNQIEERGLKYSNDLVSRLSNLPNEVLGNTRLTIGNIFKIIIDDYNWLMEQIWVVGNQGYTDIKNNVRNQQTFDRMGFPTVIQKDANGSGKIVYPGVIPDFQNWPEIKFIENFIDAYARAVKANLISDTLLSKEEDGRSKYIPINPREIYTVGSNGTDLSKASVGNVYYKRPPNEFFKLIYERFLCFANVNINIDDDSDVYSKWKNTQNIEKDWIDSTKSFLGLTDFDDEIVKKGLFYSIIEMEARNIAYAISLNDTVKKDITSLSKNFNDSWFGNNKTHELTKSLETINNDTLPLLNNLKPFDDDYVTVSDLEPQLIDKGSQPGDIISTFMRSLHDANGGYKITQDNILYIPDLKLNKNNGNNESDYDKIIFGPTFIQDNLKAQIENEGKIISLYDTENNILSFDLIKLHNNSLYPALIEVPRGLLILLGSVVRNLKKALPNNEYYIIHTDLENSNFKLNIKNNSKFYKYIFKESEDFDNKFGFRSSHLYDSQSQNFTHLKCNRIDFNIKNDNQILEYVYQKRFISVNDLSFAYNNINKTITNGITKITDKDNTLYKQYLKVLLPKIAQFIKEDDKKINDNLKSFTSNIKDPEVKLSIYKSFQVIYENFLHGVDKKDFKLEVSNNESSSFLFFDRGYNNISGIDGLEPGCILDIKTLLNDVNDYEVSLFSSMARLLSDNNFWFYPFANFLTTTENYDELFAINYNKKSDIKPRFIAMYVGGLSSNPGNAGNLDKYPVQDDGIKKTDIPPDLYKQNPYNNGVLNAFSVKFTGIQNQSVFSNIQVSTESLKNTDEGLRIQSEIINTSSNNYSIPKGQSLLNVYQKQSYSTTVKIPFGNMGIQPTQYFYQEYMPLFDGLYIIYNVSHSIDADTQRLETTFKGYRLKKDTNPIVTQQFVDYINNNIYTQTLNEIGSVGVVSSNAGSTTNLAFNPSDSFWVNARKFVKGNEGFVAHAYWDINNWRIGYGSEIMALNSSLKAPDSERFKESNFNKYYIRLPKDYKRWPQNVDLDTGQIAFKTISPVGTVPHVTAYSYNIDTKSRVQWDAKKKNDPYKGEVIEFYTRALSDRAFDYTFYQFLKITRAVNPTGFDNLTDRGKIGVTYVAYGFGSIEDFMRKIKAGIASGNDTTLAIAIIEDLAIKKGNFIRQLYYKTAKYIEPDILNKVSSATLAELKNPKYGLDLRG